MKEDIRYGRDTLSLHLPTFLHKPTIKEAKFWINHIDKFHSKDLVALKEKKYLEKYIKNKGDEKNAKSKRM